MRTVKVYLYGFLLLLFVIFVVQNYATLTYSVSLRFNLGFFSLESIPLPIFIIAPFLFFSGLLLATLMGLAERHRLSKELKQLRGNLQRGEPRMKPEEDASHGPAAPIETEASPFEEKKSTPS